MTDQNSRLPLYIQLKLWILNQIKSGKFKAGEKIPSENYLSKLHGISRPTVRQALSELVHEGFLVKKRGLGTYVSIPQIIEDATVFRTFGEEMDMLGFMHSAKIVAKKQYSSSRELAEILSINPGDKVFEIIRLRLANEKPLAIRTSIIPSEIYPNLLEEDLQTLYPLFAKKGIYPFRSKQTFQAVPALKEEATLLNVPVGEPLMLWEGIVFSQNNKPIEKVKVYYLGSQFRFEISQYRQKTDVQVVEDKDSWV